MRPALLCLTLAAALPVPSATAATGPPRLLNLSVWNGSTPYAGDGRLLTTVSPNGDGFRDRAIVKFRLTVSATVELDGLRTVTVKRGTNPLQTIATERHSFSPGRHRLVWTPARSVPNGSYVLELTV